MLPIAGKTTGTIWLKFFFLFFHGQIQALQLVFDIYEFRCILVEYIFFFQYIFFAFYFSTYSFLFNLAYLFTFYAIFFWLFLSQQ